MKLTVCVAYVHIHVCVLVGGGSWVFASTALAVNGDYSDYLTGLCEPPFGKSGSQKPVRQSPQSPYRCHTGLKNA